MRLRSKILLIGCEEIPGRAGFAAMDAKLKKFMQQLNGNMSALTYRHESRFLQCELEFIPHVPNEMIPSEKLENVDVIVLFSLDFFSEISTAIINNLPPHSAMLYVVGSNIETIHPPVTILNSSMQAAEICDRLFSDLTYNLPPAYEEKPTSTLFATVSDTPAVDLSTQLILATQEGNLEKVRELLIMPGSEVVITPDKRTEALCLAEELANSEILVELLRSGADVHGIGGRSPMAHAVATNNFPLVRIFLHFVADINLITDNSSEKRCMLMLTNDQDVIGLLISNGASSEHINRAFAHAAYDNQLDKALLLFKHGANQHIKFWKKNVFRSGEYTLEDGLSIFTDRDPTYAHYPNNRYITPLNIAIKNCHIPLAKELISRTDLFYDFSESMGLAIEHALSNPCNEDYIELIGLMLDSSGEKNKTYGYKSNFIIRATDIAEYLKGKSKEEQEAIKKCSLQIVQALLASVRADAFSSNYYKSHALILATQTDNSALVDFLLSQGVQYLPHSYKCEVEVLNFSVWLKAKQGRLYGIVISDEINRMIELVMLKIELNNFLKEHKEVTVGVRISNMFGGADNDKRLEAASLLLSVLNSTAKPSELDSTELKQAWNDSELKFLLKKYKALFPNLPSAVSAPQNFVPSATRVPTAVEPPLTPAEKRLSSSAIVMGVTSQPSNVSAAAPAEQPLPSGKAEVEIPRERGVGSRDNEGTYSFSLLSSLDALSVPNHGASLEPKKKPPGISKTAILE